MNRLPRLLAALALALLLPVQGYAAACAQICAVTQQDRAMVAPPTSAATAEEGAGPAPSDHCTETEIGAGKCCKAHAFLIDLAVAPVGAQPPLVEPASYVARWTNFIPEEPSPPPIAVSAFA